jgi:hypothetical protein
MRAPCRALCFSIFVPNAVVFIRPRLKTNFSQEIRPVLVMEHIERRTGPIRPRRTKSRFPLGSLNLPTRRTQLNTGILGLAGDVGRFASTKSSITVIVASTANDMI